MLTLQHFVLLIMTVEGLRIQSHSAICNYKEIPPNQVIVDCSSRNLSQVPNHLPRNLTVLDLSNNLIKYIHEKYFKKFQNLTDLNISNNHMLGLNNASISFYGLKNSSIKVLNASGIINPDIACVTMKKNFFTNLKDTYLEKIYLDWNRISTFDYGTFWSVPKSLQVFSLRWSRLVMAQDSLIQFGKLTNVKTLDISHLNREDVLIQDIINAFNVQEAQNNAKHVSSRYIMKRRAVMQLVPVPVPPNVETLLAKDCNFKMEVKRGMEIQFKENKLIVLDLSKNRIGKIMGKISGLEKIETLDLSENVCDHISPNFSQFMPQLKTLNLRGNALRLDTNDFTENQFQNLENLDLTSNKINKIPSDAFKGFPVLKNLTLRGNLIYTLGHIRIDHMKNLNLLDLSDNQINCIPVYVTTQLDSINGKTSKLTLNLKGNPLFCSCRWLSFVHWVCRTNVNLNRQSLQCFLDNDRKENVSFVEICEELETLCMSHVEIAMGGLAAVTGSMIIITIGLVYRFRWKLRYLYYIVRGKYRSKRMAQYREDAKYDYDAFISYAEDDEEFAVTNFTRNLEVESELRLCLHQRDFRPGESIASNILSAIQKSHHVVIVLSPNFLDSYWCRWEFEMARMEGLYTERNVVILVRYQDVLPSVVPRDMLYMMHTQTYLKYPEEQQDQDTFWTVLRQAIEDD